MKVKRKKNKGLTLIELIIVLGLMGIVTSLIFSFVNLTQKKSAELDVRQDLQHDGTMITESMMQNVLEAKRIEGLKRIGNTNSLEYIIFELNGLGSVSSDSSIENINLIGYAVEGNELNLYAHKKHDDTTRISDCEDSHWSKLQTISTNMKELKLENKNINDAWGNGEGANKLRKKIRNEKSVNLKVILEADYYADTIIHENTIELSLRNAK